MQSDNSKKMVLIPETMLKANYSREGYFERVSYHAKECKSYKEAWERTEAELQHYNLPSRYANYESFLNCRSRWLRDMNSKML